MHRVTTTQEKGGARKRAVLDGPRRALNRRPSAAKNLQPRRSPRPRARTHAFNARAHAHAQGSQRPGWGGLTNQDTNSNRITTNQGGIQLPPATPLGDIHAQKQDEQAAQPQDLPSQLGSPPEEQHPDQRTHAGRDPPLTVACYHPIAAKQLKATGAVFILGPRRSLKDSTDPLYESLTLPCSQCLGCLQERARQWAVRCLHESSCHADNCGITLTYDPQHLPPWGELDKDAMPRFLKRLRKAIAPKKVSHYYVGEYGGTAHRPHYHALIFGHCFTPTSEGHYRGDHLTWTSQALRELWPYGRHEVTNITPGFAAYVARYLTTKTPKTRYAVNLETGEKIELRAEFSRMSLRPAIGNNWWHHYHQETYTHDNILSRGRLEKPPRYYDKLYDMVRPDHLKELKDARRAAADPAEHTPARLAVRETIARARLALHKRELK